MTLKPMAESTFIDHLLRPRSVALVGVSADTSKTAARPLMFLRRAGFAGTIYPINPSRETVQEEKAYPSLSALPSRPDHVFILTGTENAIAAVEECGQLGIPVATVLAAGFSEAGEEGAAREWRLRETARRYGTRILGPSSIGVVNVHTKMVLTANAAFGEPNIPAGGVFVASQSGSLIGSLVSRGKVRGLGFSALVSVGGESDLSIGEICAATLDDPSISSYMLFLESMRHARALRDFARGAAERGKAVAAYKSGRSDVAAELAISHTGALAGEDDVADAFLRDCGIARVDTFEGLIEIMPLLRRVGLDGRRKRKPGVGVVTTTGGGAAMAVDRLALRGADIVAPSAATMTRLKDAGVTAAPGRIIDLTLSGTRYDVMKRALDVVLTAPEFDLVLVTVGSSARNHPDLAVKPIADSADLHQRPLAAFVVPEAPDALVRLAAANVPAFRTPESCADAICAAFGRLAPRAADHAAVRDACAAGQASRLLNEAEAYGLLDRLGVPHAPFTVLDRNEPIRDLPFPYPVVAKVLHKDIAHKTEVGGIALGITDRGGLEAAIHGLCSSVQRLMPSVCLEQILVQPMEAGVGELLVGVRHDPQMGPTVMVAAGGVTTEIYRDRSLRMAPVDLATAREMLEELKAMRILAGFRGKPAGDIEAAARFVAAFSRITTLPDVSVVEAEANPVLVKPDGQGVVAVDALVRIAEPEGGSNDLAS